jgi:transcriptional regulator with XRE-family HTH domain
MSKSSYNRMAMRSRTSISFDDFYAQLEAEARAEGPRAVLDLRAKEVKYALINTLITRRQALNLTQEALAEHSGIAQAEISRIERGRKSPTLDTFSRLAGALRLALWPVENGRLDALKAGATQGRLVLAARRIDQIARPKPRSTQVTAMRSSPVAARTAAVKKFTRKSRPGGASKKGTSRQVARSRKSTT